MLTKKGTSFTCLSLAVFCVAMLIVAYLVYFRCPSGKILRGKEYVGILSESENVPSRFGAWDCSAAEIDVMEKCLATYVAQETNLFPRSILRRLPEYRRYYDAMTWDGTYRTKGRTPFIRIEFFHPSFVSRREWLKGVLIHGGSAEDHWSIIYDPSSSTFSDAYPFEDLAKERSGLPTP
jgi:hypothetical protein